MFCGLFIIHSDAIQHLMRLFTIGYPDTSLFLSRLVLDLDDTIFLDPIMEHTLSLSIAIQNEYLLFSIASYNMDSLSNPTVHLVHFARVHVALYLFECKSREQQLSLPFHRHYDGFVQLLIHLERLLC
eukprot:373327_1